MPRPDLKALGVQYRRTPSIAIGRDLYVDTRLIIQRLEELFPATTQHPAFASPETEGLAKLLDKLTIDACFLYSCSIDLIFFCFFTFILHVCVCYVHIMLCNLLG